MSRRRIDLIDRLVLGSRKAPGGCVLRYPQIGLGSVPAGRASGRAVLAGKVAYQAFVGPVPPGARVLRSCGDPRCVAPAHLFTGQRQGLLSVGCRAGMRLPPGVLRVRNRWKARRWDRAAGNWRSLGYFPTFAGAAAAARQARLSAAAVACDRSLTATTEARP